MPSPGVLRLPGCVLCLPFCPLSLPLPFPNPFCPGVRGGGFCGGGGGLARSCSKLPTSDRTLVTSCKASSRDQPVLCRRDISRHSLRSAATNSWVVTVRSDASLGVCVAQSRIFLSYALRRCRCAPLHSAMALRNTVWTLHAEPCRAEAEVIHRHLRGVVKQCRAEKCGFRANGSRGLAFYEFLILLL